MAWRYERQTIASALPIRKSLSFLGVVWVVSGLQSARAVCFDVSLESTLPGPRILELYQSTRNMVVYQGSCLPPSLVQPRYDMVTSLGNWNESSLSLRRIWTGLSSDPCAPTELLLPDSRHLIHESD